MTAGNKRTERQQTLGKALSKLPEIKEQMNTRHIFVMAVIRDYPKAFFSIPTLMPILGLIGRVLIVQQCACFLFFQQLHGISRPQQEVLLCLTVYKHCDTKRRVRVLLH